MAPNISRTLRELPREMRESMLHDLKSMIVDLESKRDVLGNDKVDEQIVELRKKIQEIDILNRTILPVDIEE